ncbi:hypothetical protein DPMN_169848 [Dreissena polymorpha]|uniref:Tyrosinase copper-binding domain-containing protein n=1 Tax=Dreissena polymorpha TaxID=45954 RepID=A0A9D4DWS7_DREPO|nr:hypothetical protein DPMN_169848 [Dreissena polymorpha]
MELIFEFIHNRVHHWIGGEMKIIETATDDPIFYPYHSFVSLVWAEFRALQRSLGIDPELDWDQFYGQSRHHKYSPLGLGNLFASDGSSDVFEENILFDERPWCNHDILDCGTPYLYCNVTVEKCVPWTADEYRLIKSKALKEDKAFKDIVFPFIESKLKKGFLELLAASGNQTTLSETAEYYITQHFEDPFEGIENASSGILVGDDLATKKPLNAWEVLVNEDEKTKKHEHDHKHSHNNGDMFRENSGDNGIAHNDRNDDHDHEGHDHAHGTQAVGDVVEQNERIVEVVSSGFEQFLMHYSIWILVALLIFRVILSIVTKCVSVYSTGWRCGRLKSKYSVSGGANLNDDANKMSTLALETSGNQVAESPRPDNIYTITVASKSADNSPTVYVRFAKYENEISQLNGPNVSRPRACVPVYKSEYEATTRPTETHGNYLDMTYTSRVSDEEPTSPIAEIYELEDRAEEEEGDIENMCNSLENDNYIRSVLQELDRATFRDDMQDIMEGYDNIMNVERHRKQLGAAVATLTPVPSPRAPLTDRFEGPQPCNMTSLNDETHATATFM